EAHRLVRESAPAALAAVFLETDRFARLRAALEAYLEEWGFRGSGEVMLTVPSMQEEPSRLFELLKAYVARDGVSPLAAIERQARAREAATARALAGLRANGGAIRARAAARILAAAQSAIRYRERVRLKQALLYTKLQ